MFFYDWELRKLKDVTERVRSNDGRMDLPTLTMSASSGWLDQKDRFSGDISGKEKKNYTLLKKGELSYNHGNSKLAKYGVVFSITNYEESLVPRVYHSFKALENTSADFIEYMFSTKLPDRELGKLVSSGARMDGLLNINYDDFMNIHISIPNYEEQILMSAFFRKLDETIALHQRKLDKLKQLKQGYLQQLFPKPGETVPKIRFANFEGEWEERKLKQLGEIQTGNTPSTKDSSNYAKNGILWVTPTDIDSLIISDTAKKLSEKGQTKARIAKAGSILVTSIASIGKNALAKTDMGFNQQINSLTPSSENDSYFLLTQSEKWSEMMQRNAAAGTMQIVNKSEFSNIVTEVPKLDEQGQIGNFFAKLDQTITLQLSKINKLKSIKQALLQKMFI